MTDLKACPFCGGEAEIVIYGNTKQGTIYQCLDCSCTLETSETFNHGYRWNNRPHENKLKAEAIREAVDMNEKLDRSGDIYCDTEDLLVYADKLERGEG